VRELKTTILPFLATTLLIAACSTSNNKTNKLLNNYSPISIGLYDTIVHMDSVLFNAFNTRNLDKLKMFFSEDLEFYHDLGGITNFQTNLDAFKKTFESDRRLRREVVPGSLEVYPIKDYGAVEIGIHRFYVTEKGTKEKLGSEAKFVHLWQKKESEWKITRVISYGHQEY
jgi:hypothetical protein